MRRFLRDSSLTLVLGSFFALSLLGQVLTGWRAHDAEQEEHGEATIGVLEYVTTGHFVEATFENWESEFLQMGAYVALTVRFRKRGSPESKSEDGSDPVDEDPAGHRGDLGAPWPVRRGGIALALYKRSLSLAFFALFLGSMLLHAVGGAHEASSEAQAHGGAAVGLGEFVTTSEFWFQSLQNWQSEFLAVAVLVVLSVYLRQQGSPESKPVHEPSVPART